MCVALYYRVNGRSIVVFIYGGSRLDVLDGDGGGWWISFFDALIAYRLLIGVSVIFYLLSIR